MADTRITIDAQLQMRHDIEDNWKAVDPVLRPGEPAYTIGYDDRFKIGDGQRRWSELPYLTMYKGGAEGIPGSLAEARIIHVNMSSANEQIAEQKAYNAETYQKIVAGEKLYLLYPADAGYWMLTPIANSNGVISLEWSTTNGRSVYITTVQLSEDGTTETSMAITAFQSYQIDSEMSDISGGLVPNKIIKKYVDDAFANVDAGAVIFDATCSTDPWNLNVLQTSTTIEEIVEAINNGSPIYMRFGSGLVAVDNAELYENGDVSLYVHLVDSESELIRTIHAYSTTDGGWEWESFDNPMGGNPDEEDITTNAEGKLKFKDRGNADGMGYVILRKGKALSEQMESTNTIYEVRYDFDLATGVVEMPAGSILKFNGGCISNGTLKGSNSQIDAEPVKIFDSITFTGSWMADAIYAEWWGAEGLYSRVNYANENYAPQALVIPSAVNNLSDSSVAINAALAFSSLTGGEVHLQGLIYRTTSTIVMDRYSTMKMQPETMIVPYLTGAGTLIVTHNVDDLTMTEDTLDSPALTLARNQIIDTSSMAIAIKVNPVRTKLYGAGLLCLQKSRYTIGVCITSEGRHLMDMTYLTPSVDIVTVGDNRLTYAPDPRDIIGSGAPSASVGSGNTETIYYWDKTNKAYYSRSAGASSWTLINSASDPKWNTSLRFDIGNQKTARLINPQVTIKDIFGARGIEVYMRVPSNYVDMPFFNHSTIKGSVSEKYSHYFSIFNEKGCSFDLHDWKDVVVQHSPVNMFDSSTFYAAAARRVDIGFVWDLKWLGSKSDVDFYLGKNTLENTFVTSDGGVVVDLGVDNVFGEKKATAVVGGGATPRIEMTASSAGLTPNTFYVWGMADSLDLTLADGDAAVMNRYLFQFRNPVDSVTMLTLPDTITWSEDTELDENGMPVMEATAFYRIEIIEGFASLKKWKLAYIQFADAEVERVLMANGVGDGIGITKQEAKGVMSIGTWFRGNTAIETFDEFKYFIGVTQIGYANATTAAFMNCTNLRKITLPKSITHIGASCFDSCNLQEVPDLSMVSYLIRVGAFKNNPNMRGKVVLNATELSAQIFYNTGIDEVVINNAVEIAAGANNATTGAFGQCLNLKKVTMGDSVQIIGTACFYGCTSLSEVNFPEGLKEIRGAAFEGCTALELEELGFPNVTTVGSNAFKGVKIRKLSLPKATSILGANASVTLGDKTVLQELELSPDMTVANPYLLDGYSALTSLSGLVWENLTSLSNAAFAYVKCLPEVINASSATTVGSGTFRETNITSMVLNACTSVGSTAFYRCASLTTFIIGDACTSLGQQTFAYCAAIQAFICKATTPPSLHTQAFLGVNMTTAPIIFYVPDASVEAYKTATNWLNYATRIKGISDLQTDNPTLYEEIAEYL